MYAMRYLRYAPVSAIIVVLCASGQAVGQWRSTLYPEDWEPGYADSEGRFLHDFSYAGYHMGQKPIPASPPGDVYDVTAPPYNAPYAPYDEGNPGPADGTTLGDATSAIRQAIDDAGAAGGGVVYLPEGTYRVKPLEGDDHVQRNSVLLIKHSGVVLRGDGPERTFIFNDEPLMRDRSVVRVDAPHTPRPMPDSEVLIAGDLLEPTTRIPVLDTSAFSVGEWIMIGGDITEEWAAEHNMAGLWKVGYPGVTFHRQITAIDESNDTLVVDIPTRYYLKARDGAHVYKIKCPHSEEIGVEGLSIGMRENLSSGTSDDTIGEAGTYAYELSGASAVSFTNSINGWVRDVHTYRPPSNVNDWHIASNGILLSSVRSVTVRNCVVEKPQIRGTGGNGYPIAADGSDCLIESCTARFGRHNFDIAGFQATGNVIYNCQSEGSTLRNRFHKYLSPANLVDNLTMEGQDDWLEVVYGTSGGMRYGYTSTQSVFWNARGVDESMPWLIKSQQWGWGYIIGTRGATSAVQLGTDDGTAPEDFLEGEGLGDTLVPSSLYLDQLEKRKARSNNAAPVAIDDAYGIQEGATLTVNAAAGLLANDSDAEEDPLTTALVVPPAHGILTLNADGSLVYVHDGGEESTDSFTYRASDWATDSEVATVTLTINGVNDTPSDILLSNAALPEGQPVRTTVGTLSAIDPDVGEAHIFTLVDGKGGDDNASFIIEADPSKSVALLKTDAVFLYEGQSSYSVRVRVDDGHGGVFERVLTVTVENVSDDLDGDEVLDAVEAAGGTDPFDTANPTPVMSVTPGSLEAPLQGGAFTVAIMNTGRGILSWDATIISGDDWLTIAEGESGSVGGSVGVSCTKNQTGALRTGVIRVVSSNAVGGPVDVVVRQELYQLPDVPANIQASDGTEVLAVLVTWGPVADGTYAVYRNNVNDFASASLLGSVVIPSYEDTTATPPVASSGCAGTQNFVYYYWVVALNSSGASAPSASDTGYRGLAASKASIYESVLPAKATGEGMLEAQLDSTLAIRLRSAEPIDLESIRGTVTCSSFATDSVVWQPVSDTDGWVVFEPESLWQFDDTVVMTVGGRTMSGDPIGPVTHTFLVESEDMLLTRCDKHTQVLWQPQPEHYAAMGMEQDYQIADPAIADEYVAPALDNGAGPVCVVGPDRLFEAPQWVWLPVPEGVSMNALSVFYFKTNGPDAGWHPGHNVDGWLVPGGYVAYEFDGVPHLGFLINHGGVVQLAPSIAGPAELAGLLHGDIVVFGLLMSAVIALRRKTGLAR